MRLSTTTLQPRHLLVFIFLHLALLLGANILQYRCKHDEYVSGQHSKRRGRREKTYR